MKSGTTGRIAVGLALAVIGTLVWAYDAQAQPFRGGLPQCLADLEECETGVGVPRTGQTGCWAANGNVIHNCEGPSATGQDGAVQAGVAWPSPRFTDNGDGTVTDNSTGLVWLKDWSCLGSAQWATALDKVNVLADGTADGDACGLSDGSMAGDWRLPNRNELESLLDMQFVNPAVSNTTGTGQWTADDPFTNVQNVYYWSSTTFVDDPSVAWIVSIGFGSVNGNVKAGNHRVLAVSGGGS